MQVYDGVYLANVTLGTLGQYFRLILANDASDTWVNAVNSTVCQNNTQACQSAGICRFHSCLHKSERIIVP